MADKTVTITVDGLIKDASAKMEQREQLVEQIAGCREMLRYLDKGGQTTAEEKKWIAEAFPARKPKDESANGAAAE